MRKYALATPQRLIVFGILLIIFSILIFTNSFSYAQDSITDNLHGRGNVLDNIVIIKIDDKSINQLGRWPWNRKIFSEIVSKIPEAKVIGMDISFFEKSQNDYALNETISKMENIVLAAEISESEKIYEPIFDSDFGYVNIIPGSNGVIRSLRTDAKREITPFSFEIYKKSGGKKNIEFFSPESRIKFSAPPGKFFSISAVDLLNENITYDFKNKIILIGATAQNLHDLHMVPTSNGVAMPGVEIQAHIIQNFMLESFIKKQNKILDILLVFLISAISMLGVSRLKIIYLIPISAGIIFLYALIGIFLFNNSNYLIDFFFFPVSIVIFTGAGIGVNYLEEKKRSEYISGAFEKYINKDLLKRIIEQKQNLKLGGEKRMLSIFFSDIRDFTSISETITPEELTYLINKYLTEMTKIIFEHKGTIDKFIGDAIMAFWNAPLDEPEHAKLSCKSAIAQINAVKKINKEIGGKKFPGIKIGCGINTGETIVGNFGSEERFNYTAVGDAVNIASRLEGLTKYYGVDIILSEST